MMNQKKLPVGIESFEELRRGNFYYVDKTGLIKSLLTNWGKAYLFTRPRRFGKSLNMSMFQNFFEIGSDPGIFDNLAIAGEHELCEKYMGKFPVISISLKGITNDSFQGARASICSIIANEALHFYNLLKSEKLNDIDKAKYRMLITLSSDHAYEEFFMSDTVLSRSLRTLTELLQKHFDKQVIVLIDEYDVPLAKANERGYYPQMVDLIRSLFENALKTNNSLYFAILTGCLRVAKESIFTGLNNFNVFSITDTAFEEYFGFTDTEVRELLQYYGLENHYPTVKEWYDGYRFGNMDVYCPWDVICYCSKNRGGTHTPPQNYWVNTSGNDIVKHFIDDLNRSAPSPNAPETAALTKTELEHLINGGSVQKQVRQELTYAELYASPENIWSALFMTGYLTQRGEPDGDLLNLVIPNREIRNIFTDHVMTLFKEKVAQDGALLKDFCDALSGGRASDVERLFSAYMDKTISVRDTFVKKATKENFYHGILLGILGFKAGWMVTSNREAGDGFSDIMIRIDDSDVGILIEIKYAQDGDMEAVCRQALVQIEQKRYAEGLYQEGIHTVLRYGIACFRKKCKVLFEKSQAKKE